MPKKIESASNAIGDITKPALQRLCHRVGIPRVSGVLYEELRGNLLVFLEEYLARVVTFTEHERKQTISVNHAYAGMWPTKVLLTTKELDACKPKSKIPQICVTFPKAPFLRLVRGVVAQYKPDLRIQHEASIIIQYYAEMFLLKLLAVAFKMALQAQRETVQPKDIQLARYTLMLQL
jgi:histone H3/H4